MKITKRQLRRIIREEYSRLQRGALIREMAGDRLQVGSSIGKNHIGPSGASFPGLRTIGELMYGNSIDGTGFYIAEDDDGNYYLPDQYGDTPFDFDEIHSFLYGAVSSKKKKKKKKARKTKSKMQGGSMRAPMDLGNHYVANADSEESQDALSVAMELGISNPRVVGQVGGVGSNYVIITDGMGNYYLPLTAAEEEAHTMQELIQALDYAAEDDYY